MKADDLLKDQISKGNIASSYIFWGSDMDMLFSSASEFAKSLKISNFDIIKIEPEIQNKERKGEIKISVVRELIRAINLTPGHGEKKIAIVKNADKLNIQAANTLLKTLEEPPENTIIILLSSDLKLLPTIISRCQIIRFPDRISDEDPSIIENLDLIKKEDLKKIFAVANRLSEEENLENFLDSILVTLRKNLSEKSEVTVVEKMKAVFEAKRNINITNNRRLVLENLFIKLKYIN